MIKSDFYGNDFVWWAGVVENRNDPLKSGLVQVRIFGLHPFDDAGKPDTVLVATKTLPWAQVVMSTDGTKTSSGPRENDWVFGFFQDGRNAQIPVIIGTYSGIESKESLSTAKEVPKPPTGIIDRKIDEPTTPRLSRGVLENTLVNKTNQEITQVCDISNSVHTLINNTKIAFGTIIQSIRDFIRSLLNTMGFEPSGEIRRIIQIAKDVMTEIRRMKYLFNELNSIKSLILDGISKIRQMIDNILNIPMRLLKFVAGCLINLTSGIAGGLASLINVPGTDQLMISELAGISGKLAGVSTTLSSAISQVVGLAVTPIQGVDAFLNASAELSTSNQSIGNWLSNSFTSILNGTNSSISNLAGNLPSEISTLSPNTIQALLNPTSRADVATVTSDFTAFLSDTYQSTESTASAMKFNTMTYPGP